MAFSPLFLPVAVSWDCGRIEIAMVTPHINSISDLSNIWPTHFSYLSYDFSSYPNRSNKGSKTPLGTVKGICKSCCKTSRAWILGKSRPNVINSGSFLLLQLCFMSNCRLVDFFCENREFMHSQCTTIQIAWKGSHKKVFNNKTCIFLNWLYLASICYRKQAKFGA